MEKVKNRLLRFGTNYIPVTDVTRSAEWYAGKLGAEVNYKDENKAIIALADQSFFLVRAQAGETSNFVDSSGAICFSVTFEVDGLGTLKNLNEALRQLDVATGEIEDRGHAGRNFVFEDPDGNKFDVWSELSPGFKRD